MALPFFASLGYTISARVSPAEYFLDLLQQRDASDSRRIELIVTAFKNKGFYHEAIRQSREANLASEPKSNENLLVNKKREDCEKEAGEDESGNQTRKLCVGCYYAMYKTYILTKRSRMTESRMPILKVARLLQCVLLSFLIGLAFLQLDTDQDGIQNRLGLIYFIIIAQMFSNAMNVVLTFSEEREHFMHEQQAVVYSPAQYFIAKTLVDIPSSTLVSIIFSCVVYALTGLSRTWPQFRVFITVMVLLGFTGQSFGLVVGSAVKDKTLATVLAPITVAPFILFTPFAMQEKYIPVLLVWIKEISPFWWSFTALAANEFAGLKIRCEPHQMILMQIPGTIGYSKVCSFVEGEQILSRFKIEQDISKCIMMLLLLGGLFRFGNGGKEGSNVGCRCV